MDKQSGKYIQEGMTREEIVPILVERMQHRVEAFASENPQLTTKRLYKELRESSSRPDMLVRRLRNRGMIGELNEEREVSARDYVYLVHRGTERPKTEAQKEIFLQEMFGVNPEEEGVLLNVLSRYVHGEIRRKDVVDLYNEVFGNEISLRPIKTPKRARNGRNGESVARTAYKKMISSGRKATKIGSGRQRRALELYFKDVAYGDLLTHQEEIDLMKRIRQGDQKSLNQMIEANLRFVITIAKEYQGRGLPLEDLIAEGNLGLVRSVHRYDENVGVKFTTYGVWWIRQGILSALAEKARMVRLPVNKIKHLARLERVASELKQELGRDPDVHEIADRAEMKPKQAQDLLDASRWHLSLDMPLEEDLDTSLLEMLEDKDAIPPDEELMERGLKEEVRQALDTLSPREAQVLRYYFGISKNPGEDVPSMTLEKIGKELSLTKERVRQIRDKALGRLKHPSRMRKIKTYMYGNFDPEVDYDKPVVREQDMNTLLGSAYGGDNSSVGSIPVEKEPEYEEANSYDSVSSEVLREQVFEILVQRSRERVEELAAENPNPRLRDLIKKLDTRYIAPKSYVTRLIKGKEINESKERGIVSPRDFVFSLNRPSSRPNSVIQGNPSLQETFGISREEEMMLRASGLLGETRQDLVNLYREVFQQLEA